MWFPRIMSSANALWGNEDLGIRAHNFNSVFLELAEATGNYL